MTTDREPVALVMLLTGRTKPINIKLPIALLERVEELAGRHGRTKSWVVKALLFLYATGRIDFEKLAKEAGL